MKKFFAMVVAGVMIGALALPVMADGRADKRDARTQTVSSTKQAYLRGDIDIVVGDKEVDFKTSSGKAVYPIIYQSRTYLPLRAIGEVMGKNVNWDANTKTITIAGNRTSTSSDKDNPDVGTKLVSVEERKDFTIVVGDTVQHFTDNAGNTMYPLLYEGSTYLPLRAIGDIMGSDIQWDSKNLTVIIKKDGLVTDADSFKPDGFKPDSNQQYITREKAKEIALDDSGKKASEVTFVTAKMETENGKVVYDIEFYSGNTEYDYEIDATNGKILSKDMDIEDFTINPNGQYITREKAKEIALDDSGKKASEVTFITAKMETENGRVIYDVEFYSGNTEYDYEIDATNGKILSKDWDVEGFVIDSKPTPQPDSKPNNNKVTLEQAKKIALKHAGVSEKDVIFTKAKLDYDDGRQKYELEFVQGRMEYECDIDVATGNILEYDADYDD